MPSPDVPNAISFASDNTAPVAPEVLQALAEANDGYADPYGADAWTQAVQASFREAFGEQALAYPVLTGTGANVMALDACLHPGDAILATELAHIHEDESGAPERLLGCKVYPLPHRHGKLEPAVVEAFMASYRRDEHRPHPAVLSLTQATEYGTVYTPHELHTLCQLAKAEGMLVHLDGARLTNAAAHLGLPFRAFTTDVGVDVVTLGGTKTGLMFGEAVVFLNPTLAGRVLRQRKQAMQLASKGRYLAAQWQAYFANQNGLRWARHANALAQQLRAGLAQLPGVQITRPVEANAVFATFPPAVLAALQAQFRFYTWDAAAHEARLMCTQATTPADVEAFLQAARQLLVPQA